MNRYYFSLSIQFKKDIDLDKFQNYLGIEATKLTMLEDSKGPNKTAKFYYRTESMENIFPDKDFEQFVDDVADKLVHLPQIMEKNDGDCAFCIVFEEMDEKPCLSLSAKTIKKLCDIGATYDVDFLV